MESARRKRESKRALWGRKNPCRVKKLSAACFEKFLGNIPAQFSRYEIIGNQLTVRRAVRAFTSEKLIRRARARGMRRIGQTDGRTTTCVIAFSKRILLAKIARLRRSCTGNYPAFYTCYGRRIGRDSTRRDSGISLNSERLVNRKLKVESERQRPFVPGGASKKKGRDKRVKSRRGANLCQAPCLSRLSVEETEEGNANHATITHLTRRFNCALSCSTLIKSLVLRNKEILHIPLRSAGLIYIFFQYT